MSTVVTGTVIGAYRVLDRIGEGGMGAVWLAEHTLLGRRAAIKLLHSSFSVRDDIVRRFFNEARAATTISDPGIVQIYDFGHHTDGSAYIVMELLEGESLEKRLRRLGVLRVMDAMRIMRQTASSLGAAHARGIVHRDLKPDNLFVVRDPEVAGGERVKILDFGIAKFGDASAAKTNTNALMGTPVYMSPEQCRGAGFVDARSDVYSLGCVLFTLVRGRPPFEGEGMGDIIACHLREPAPRLSAVMSGIPPALDELVARCLAKASDERFADGGELAAALTLAIDAAVDGPAAPRQASPIAATRQHATTLESSAASLASPREPAKRSGLGLGLGVGAAVAVIAIAGVVIAGRSHERREDAAAPAPPVGAKEPAAPPPAPAASSGPEESVAPRLEPVALDAETVLADLERYTNLVAGEIRWPHGVVAATPRVTPPAAVLAPPAAHSSAATPSEAPPSPTPVVAPEPTVVAPAAGDPPRPPPEHSKIHLGSDGIPENREE